MSDHGQDDNPADSEGNILRDQGHSTEKEAPDAVDCCNACLAKVCCGSPEAKKNIVVLMFEFVGSFFMASVFIEGSGGA